MDKKNKINNLNKEILKCNKCELNKLRGFGYGNLNSSIMFLGQNPGRQPKNSKIKSCDIIPFSLNKESKMISVIGFKKLLKYFNLTDNDFYITNVIKCPKENNNHPPNFEEINNCKEFLNTEIELQNPKLIIGLGASAAPKFCN